MLRPGDTIEYLADVSSPPNQKGIRGQTKIIDRDIPMWTAKFLLRGGKVRLFDPASPLQLEEEESATADKTKKSPDGPTEHSAMVDKSEPTSGPTSVTSTKDRPALGGSKKERRTENNGRRKIFSKADQAGVHGAERSDSKRGARSSGG